MLNVIFYQFSSVVHHVQLFATPFLSSRKWKWATVRSTSKLLGWLESKRQKAAVTGEDMRHGGPCAPSGSGKCAATVEMFSGSPESWMQNCPVTRDSTPLHLPGRTETGTWTDRSPPHWQQPNGGNNPSVQQMKQPKCPADEWVHWMWGS